MNEALTRSLLGDEAPDAVWRRLCPEAVECFSFEVNVGALFGLVVHGGERIALKVRRAASAERLAAIQEVQAHLWRHGFPCPRPHGVRGHATLEEWRDEGVQRDAREPPVRRALAALLVRLLRLTQGVRLPVELPPFFPPPGGPLWPEPHSVLIDFEATATGAKWIDEIAAAARAARDAGGTRTVIAHHDWTAKHVRFVELEPVVVHDWDSVGVDYEPVVAGNAAEHFTWDGPFPTADESLLFIADYERARPSPFTKLEQAVAAAAAAYARAYTTRCVHALGGDLDDLRLAEYAAALLQ